jgi:ankyrin repeat protein
MSIHSACIYGNIKLLENLLKENPLLINSLDLQNNNLLQNSSINGKLNIAKIILGHIKDDHDKHKFIHYKNNAGFDAFQLAVKHSRTDMIEFLLEFDILIGTKNAALQLATNLRNYKIILILIEFNIYNNELLMRAINDICENNRIIKERTEKINRYNGSNKSQYAWDIQIINQSIENNNLCQKIVKILLTKNNVKIDKDALLIAIREGCADIVEILLNFGRVQLEDNPNFIFELAIKSSLKTTNLIVNKIINDHNIFSMLSKKNKYYIFISSLQKQYDSIAFNLLINGVYFEDIDSDGNSTLMIALQNKCIRVAIKLIELGIQLNQINKNFDNALTIAIKMGYNDIATIIIKKDRNAYIDYYDMQGNNILMILVNTEQFDMLKTLLHQNKDDVQTLIKYKIKYMHTNSFTNFTRCILYKWIQNNGFHKQKLVEIINLLPNKEILLYEQLGTQHMSETIYLMAIRNNAYDFLSFFGIKNIIDYYKEKDYDKIFDMINITKKIIPRNQLSGDCPICYMNEINIETNCKHHYCIDCFVQYHCIKKARKCGHCRTNIGQEINVIV